MSHRLQFWNCSAILIFDLQVEAEYPEEAMECSLAGSIMKLIGHDGNIIERTLGEDTILLDGVSTWCCVFYQYIISL